MNEIELRKLPVNDTFGQCLRKLRIYPENITEKRREEMKNCEHLFVVLKKGQETFGFHSSDYTKEADAVECVHCGLTNKFKALEFLLSENYNEFTKSFSGMIPSFTRYNKRTLESEMFDKIFEKFYTRGMKSFNNSRLNLISDEVLYTEHPGLLYKLALLINSEGNNKDIFEIMKKLHSIENEQERIRLYSIDQAQELLNRYYTSIPKTLVKRK